MTISEIKTELSLLQDQICGRSEQKKIIFKRLADNFGNDPLPMPVVRAYGDGYIASFTARISELRDAMKLYGYGLICSEPKKLPRKRKTFYFIQKIDDKN